MPEGYLSEDVYSPRHLFEYYHPGDPAPQLGELLGDQNQFVCVRCGRDCVVLVPNGHNIQTYDWVLWWDLDCAWCDAGRGVLPSAAWDGSRWVISDRHNRAAAAVAAGAFTRAFAEERPWLPLPSLAQATEVWSRAAEKVAEVDWAPAPAVALVRILNPALDEHQAQRHLSLVANRDPWLPAPAVQPDDDQVRPSLARLTAELALLADEAAVFGRPARGWAVTSAGHVHPSLLPATGMTDCMLWRGDELRCSWQVDIDQHVRYRRRPRPDLPVSTADSVAAVDEWLADHDPLALMVVENAWRCVDFLNRPAALDLVPEPVLRDQLLQVRRFRTALAALEHTGEDRARAWAVAGDLSGVDIYVPINAQRTSSLDGRTFPTPEHVRAGVRRAT